jgi:hypothetical protein
MTIIIAICIAVPVLCCLLYWAFFVGVLQARLYYRDPGNANCRMAGRIIKFCDEEDAKRGEK